MVHILVARDPVPKYFGIFFITYQNVGTQKENVLIFIIVYLFLSFCFQLLRVGDKVLSLRRFKRMFIDSGEIEDRIKQRRVY